MIIWLCLLLLPLVNSQRLTAEENTRLVKNCGALLLSNRIRRAAGGAKIAKYRYPWLSIVKTYGGNCTGTLISPRHILTAAHCVLYHDKPDRENCEKSPLRPYPGDMEVLFPRHWSKHWFKKSKVYYGDFDDCTSENDIAILELSEEVPDFIATPICMPDRYHPVEDLSVAGTGLPDHELRVVRLDFERMEKGFIVTRASPPAGICPGDSGGPLFTFDMKEDIVQMGITSNGDSCPSYIEAAKPETRYLDRFTDVREHLDWICEKTGICPQQ